MTNNNKQGNQPKSNPKPVTLAPRPTPNQGQTVSKGNKKK